VSLIRRQPYRFVVVIGALTVLIGQPVGAQESGSKVITISPSGASSSRIADARAGDELVFKGSRVIAGPSGTTVIGHDIRYDGGSTTLTVRTDEDGEIWASAASIEGGGQFETDSEGELLVAPGACNDDAWNYQDAKPGVSGVQKYKIWPNDLPFRWWFNSGSNPTNLILENTEDSLRDGTNAWPTVHNNCDLSDDISTDELSVSYAGRSPNASVNIDGNGTCAAATNTDGVNRVGFGELPSFVAARTCIWIDSNYSPGRLKESDIRFNKHDNTWWNTVSSCTGTKLIVRALMTHERGHSFGLGHVDEEPHGNLTMSEQWNKLCKQPEYTLGLGDVKGLRALYNIPPN
jgi:hypothetical protein